ncbi:DNA-primase RepB domain-containing protein, partial [Edaphobacter modestus]
FNPCAVVETSAGNFQAWLKHPTTFPKLLGTFAAQTLAKRYDADPSAADWRRFGRLPGFTNCKPKYRKSDGLFPFVRLHSHSGQQYPMAEAFEQEITTLYEAREQEHEAMRLESSLSPRRGPRLSNLSLERFRSSTRYQDRPAAADIAFCVAAFANGMTEDRIGCALKTITSPAIPALPSELPTSGEPWRRRRDGPSDEHRCRDSPLWFFLPARQ